MANWGTEEIEVISVLWQVFKLSGHSILFLKSKASIDFQCHSGCPAVLQFGVQGFILGTEKLKNTVSAIICEKSDEMSSVIYILYSLLLFSEDCRVIFSNHLLPYVPSDICNKEGSSTQVARGILHCSERLWRLRTSATSVLVLEKRYQNVKSIGDVTKSSRHYVKHGVWSVSKAVRWSSRSAEATEPIYQKNMPLLGLDERTGSQKVSK